jgi:Zn-dependent protease with chaperone function
VGFWIAGVTLLSVRMMAAWLLVQRMRRSATIATGELAKAARVVASRLGIVRPVQILQSVLVSVPTAVGAIRPAILWPASLASGLSPSQIEAVIAHELAHIRRFDYFVNLLQTGVETLLFYHPAVWLVSGRIRSEREHCCDDMAVSVCGDRLTYVDALACLEERRSDRPALAVGADGSSLVSRVQRLLGKPATDDRRDPIWILVTVATLALMLTANRTDATLSPSPMPERAQPVAAPQPAAAATTPVQVVPPVPVNRPALPVAQELRADGSGEVIRWSRFGTTVEVHLDGTLTIADDERDVTGITPNGYFRITESRLLGQTRTIDVSARTGGVMERRYFVDGKEQSYEPEGKAWLAETLPAILRRGGIAIESMVAKILKQYGSVGVLSEISQLESNSVRARYFREFFKQARPGGALFTQALEQASQEIKSDFELAQLLIAVGTLTPPSSPVDWSSYFEAIESVNSSFERRRILSALTENAPSADTVTRVLRSVNGISSSFERASTLINVAEHNKLDPQLRDVYLEAANAISSGFERNRALAALSRNAR